MSSAFAVSQGAYQAAVEKSIRELREMRLAGVSLLEWLREAMGVSLCAVIRQELGGQFVVEWDSPEGSVDPIMMGADLLEQLSYGHQRCGIIVSRTAPQYDVLFCRLSGDRQADGWNRALVCMGRKGAALSGGTQAFLTRDFRLVGLVADLCVESESFRPDRDELFKTELARELGRQVEINETPDSTIISHVISRGNLGEWCTQASAESCIECLYGGTVLHQAALYRLGSRPSALGAVDEFGINIYDYPVYGRQIGVLRALGSGETEVVVPKGWWWEGPPLTPRVSNEAAARFALDEESKRQSEVKDLTAQVQSSVLWPEDPRGRVARVVQISSREGFRPTYFIDSWNGTVIRRRLNVRR